MINFRNTKTKRIVSGIIIVLLIVAMIVPLCVAVM